MSPTRYPSLAHRKQAAKRAEARDAAARRAVASWTDGRPPEHPTPEISYAPDLLPDAPGYVHGIVQADPCWVIQCDSCGRVAVGESRNRLGHRSNLVILSAGIQFGHDSDPRRLCARCRVDAGWRDYDTQQCRDDAKTLAFYEASMQDRDPALLDMPAHLAFSDHSAAGNVTDRGVPDTCEES